jgi:hypothetical protein
MITYSVYGVRVCAHSLKVRTKVIVQIPELLHIHFILKHARNSRMEKKEGSSSSADSKILNYETRITK